jgi:hypothetical protein
MLACDKMHPGSFTLLLAGVVFFLVVALCLCAIVPGMAQGKFDAAWVDPEGCKAVTIVLSSRASCLVV